MARTPKRLFGPLQSTTGAAGGVVYTVPASTKAIVRHIHLDIVAGATGTYYMAIGTAGSTGTANRIFEAMPITANTTIDHWCYYVLEATETITAWTSGGATGAIVHTGNGEEYTLG